MLYSSPDIIGMIESRMRWVRNVALLEEKCIQSFGRKNGKRKMLLGRHKHIWEINIIIYLTEIGLSGVDKSHLTQYMDDRWPHINRVRNLRVPYNSGSHFCGNCFLLKNDTSPWCPILNCGSLYCCSYIIPFNIKLVNMSALQIHEVYHSSGIILLFLLKY
jgi:hypothetical protein